MKNKPTIALDLIKQITDERRSRYGTFLENAVAAQSLKRSMRAHGTQFQQLPEDVKEALDLIALKISRIITGDPEYIDNWDDIAGYAKCVTDRIRG